MDKEQVEICLNQAQVTLQSIQCVAEMFADQSNAPEGPIAESLKILARVASGQISEAFQYMKDNSGGSNALS